MNLVFLIMASMAFQCVAQVYSHLTEEDPEKLPDFTPTRRPTWDNRGPQEAPPTPKKPQNERKKVAETKLLSTTNRQDLEEARKQSRSSPQKLHTVLGEEELSKGTGLETYLDDMNHDELRAVASGHPIQGLFKPKTLSEDDQLDERIKHSLNRQHETNNALDGSHSEHQVYTECALILQRTYVKNIKDPKHQLVPFGKTEQSCISYKHIDKALARAKQLLKFKLRDKKGLQTSLEPSEELVANLGELSMATTQILADQFELSNDELLNGLPLIDMSRTKFWPLCPALVRQDLKCQLSRFRSPTGHCNNLKHPSWGAAMTPFARYLPPVHPDGIWVPRKSIVTEYIYELAPGHQELHAGVSSSLPALSRPVFDEPDAAGSIQMARRAKAPLLSSRLPSPETPKSNVKAEGKRSNWPETRLASEESKLEKRQQPESLEQASRRNSRSVPTELPSARLVTSIVHRDIDLPHHDFSILFMSWGQLLDHDMTRASQPPATIQCCGEGDEEKHKLCLPIKVPPGDPLYSEFNIQCLEFRRSLAGLRPNCVLGPRVHQNAITAPIDANFVYGSSQAHADALRLFKGGRLRNRNWFRKESLKPLLPAQEEEPDKDCLGRPDGLFCFLAGDVRANEQIHLTVLHTMYMREHNRIAERLEEINSHWDDERIYQETRHIMAAGVQHVMLNEYLPLLIGRKMCELYNLTAHESSNWHSTDDETMPSGSHWYGYDPTVTTSVSNSFAAAAFRQGHTFVQSTVERYNKYHELVSSDRLRNLLKRPFLIYQPGVLDELANGMLNQPSQGYDPFISQEISGHLFQPPKAKVGHDLPAINLQRGREQGLPGYNLFREWCGLPRAETFGQLERYLSNHTAYHYSRLYKHVDDIDLWSGGVSERRLPGAAIGPTFACIIARQFSNTRRGDRFWYENPNLPSSFTGPQLAEIRRISLAKIICSNSDDLPTVQRWALRMPHPVLNPRLPCHKLPELDLRHWREH